MQESDLWIVFIVTIAVLLALDLAINRKGRHITTRAAGVQTVVWVAVALLFGVLFFIVTEDSDLTLEYFTSYAIEEAMSMDNLFVFIVVFAYFGVKDNEQHRALLYGVFGAMVFRAIFIFAGVELLKAFDWLFYIFGFVLVYAAYRTLVQKGDGDEGRVARYLKTHFRTADDEGSRGRLFVKVDGRRVVTMLMLCIVAIELTDLVFAMDSIPAVLAISADTMVIYTSNIFAVMGLRALYLVIRGGMKSLAYLNYGLGVILLFVAAKMLVHEFYDIPILASLAFIVVVLVITVAASMLKRRGAGAEGSGRPRPTVQPFN